MIFVGDRSSPRIHLAEIHLINIIACFDHDMSLAITITIKSEKITIKKMFIVRYRVNCIVCGTVSSAQNAILLSPLHNYVANIRHGKHQSGPRRSRGIKPVRRLMFGAELVDDFRACTRWIGLLFAAHRSMRRAIVAVNWNDRVQIRGRSLVRGGEFSSPPLPLFPILAP